MRLPSAKEVFEAIGYSLGSAAKWWKARRFSLARVTFSVLVLTGAIYGSPYAANVLVNVPAAGAWALFALGVFLLGAAAFCYVLFSFLTALMRVSPQAVPDVKQIIHNAVRTATPQPETEGAFTPYDEDRGYLQEQFEELVKAGILNETDNIDEVLGENKDFDFDKIKAKARG